MQRSLGDELSASWRGAFGQLYTDLARNILTWKGWADTIKNLATNLAGDMLTSFFKGFFKPLEDKMADVGKKIGDLLGTMWGGGSKAASTGTTVASGGASAGGAGGGAGAALGGASSLMGTITAIAGVGTMISSIIGNFQAAKQETTLNAIEHNTRYSMMYLGERGDGGILGAIFNMSGQVSWGPGVKAMESLRDNFVDFRASFQGGGTSGGKGGGITFNNCSFTGSPQQIADAIFSNAQLAGYNG